MALVGLMVEKITTANVLLTVLSSTSFMGGRGHPQVYAVGAM